MLVRETRNRQIPLFDAAWTMAVETGALQWMPPHERSLLAESYTSQRINSDLVNQEMASWTELAAFAPGELTTEESQARLRAVRTWQGYAGRVALASCLHAARLERSLHANLERRRALQACESYRPEKDPAVLYEAWGVTPPTVR